MSIGPMSSIAGGLGSAQRTTDASRAQHDNTTAERAANSSAAAESAAGIGETDGKEHQTGERDADGRRPWEIEAERKNALKERAMADEGVQALLEVFPAEIRDVEEM